MAFTQISGDGLKNNSITNAHLHSGANIAASKLADSGVTAGSYGSASLIPAITVNAQGLVTSVSTNSFTTTDNNFTDDLLSKLNGIANNATNVTNYVTNDASDELSGDTYTFSGSSGQKIVLNGATNPYIHFHEGTTAKAYIQWNSDGYLELHNQETSEALKIASGSNGLLFRHGGTDKTVWHSGNSNFVTADASDTLTGGTYTFSSSTAQKIILSGATNPYIRFQEGTTNKAYLQWHGGDGAVLLVNEESGEYIKMGSGNNGLQFIVDGTARNVLHSGNVSSYAVPVGGGTMTGDLTINGNSFLRIGDGAGQERILIQKADNNQSDHIIFYNGTTRVGEIGVEDGSWLRLNQESGANIYTPRVFRADGGFQVNGSTVVDSNKNLTVPANADLNLANGSWTGNHAKIQHHNDTVYIVGGTNGIILREGGANRWLMDGSGHLYPGINNYYDFGAVNNIVRDIYCSTVFLGQSTRYLSNVNGDYGSVQINGGGANGYEGFSIDGRVVFMHSGGSDSGIYNDVNNEWMLYCGHNTTSILYFNGAQRVRTESYGCRIAGTIRPNSTNGGDCGASDARWGTVYASNGTINTSDKNEKNTIIDSDLGLEFINKLKAVSYKWNDEEIGEKTHYGLVAQDIEETIKEIGKDVDNIGMIDKPEKGAMGLNYNELIAPLVKAIQELSAKVAALEAA